MHDHNDAHWKIQILTDADNIHHPVEPCLLAARESAYSLKYIYNPHPEVCLAAVLENGHTLPYVPAFARVVSRCGARGRHGAEACARTNANSLHGYSGARCRSLALTLSALC